MDSKWQPWIDFEEEQEPLPISEPPCKHCEHWNPIKDYRDGMFSGVILCHYTKMCQDFSCFEEKIE